MGQKYSQLNETQSRVIQNMLKERKSQTEDVAQQVFRIIFPYRSCLKTIATDIFSKFAAHQYITMKNEVPVYFADPYSSWQKGAIENANKLICQYLPKNTELHSISRKLLLKIQTDLNDRPRKKLGYNPPSKSLELISPNSMHLVSESTRLFLNSAR